MVVVLIYFLVIVLDFSVPEIVKAVENAFTEEYQSFSAPPASQPAASLTPVVPATSRVRLLANLADTPSPAVARCGGPVVA